MKSMPFAGCSAGCRTLQQANPFLRKHYIAEFNRRFQVPAAQSGSAFCLVPAAISTTSSRCSLSAR
jgi:hypothetical protein